MAVGTFTALYQAQFPFLLFIVPISYYIKSLVLWARIRFSRYDHIVKKSTSENGAQCNLLVTIDPLRIFNRRLKT
jgi:hypothetical protein